MGACLVMAGLCLVAYGLAGIYDGPEDHEFYRPEAIDSHWLAPGLRRDRGHRPHMGPAGDGEESWARN